MQTGAEPLPAMDPQVEGVELGDRRFGKRLAIETVTNSPGIAIGVSANCFRVLRAANGALSGGREKLSPLHGSCTHIALADEEPAVAWISAEGIAYAQSDKDDAFITTHAPFYLGDGCVSARLSPNGSMAAVSLESGRQLNLSTNGLLTWHLLRLSMNPSWQTFKPVGAIRPSVDDEWRHDGKPELEQHISLPRTPQQGHDSISRSLRLADKALRSNKSNSRDMSGFNDLLSASLQSKRIENSLGFRWLRYSTP
jgi:hypothetical protein